MLITIVFALSVFSVKASVDNKGKMLADLNKSESINENIPNEYKVGKTDTINLTGTSIWRSR